MKNRKKVEGCKVAILMGSDSDLPIMQKAFVVLEEFGVNYCVTVASAHRSPGYLHGFLDKCEQEGIAVYIAGAGGAAHLAGVVASSTVKPVIGVPINSKLNGLDSLLSTAQMPFGIPVATVAVDGAANAAMLAVEILAVADKKLQSKLSKKRVEMETAVIKKAKNLKV
jgi:5-(carboxyamino)imidazole ribonucleotide mutase